MGWVRCGLGTPSEVLSLPTPSEASGAIARFNTDLTENLLSAVAEFSASQASGTPTPSTPIPIVGVDKVNVTRTGKNLVSDILTGMTVSSSGSVVSSGSSNSLAIAPVKSGYKYTITTDDASNFVGGFFTDKPVQGSVTYNGSRIVGQAKTFTAPIDGWVAFRTSYEYATAQLEFGETSTTYEAPTVVTALINLGGTYYGGEVDAVTGKTPLTVGFIEFDGSVDENWSYYSISSNTHNLFRITVADRKSGNINQQSGDIDLTKFKCNSYVVAANSGIGRIDGTFSGSGTYVDFVNDNCSTVEQWRTYLASNPITFCYELATPIVVYASNTAEIPTIVGDNQVFADSGNIAVKFLETVGHKI